MNLFVVFVAACNDPVSELFLPFWQKSGCNILVSSPMDAPSKLQGVEHVNFGGQLTPRAEDYWFLQSRMLDTFKYCLTLPYDGFIFTQHDSICLGPLPEIKRSDSIHRFACGPMPQFEARVGLHPPWCFGRDRLQEFVEAASVEPIDLESGIMDRWMPCVMQRHNLAMEPCLWGWSANKIDTPSFVISCRQAIANGTVFVHGVGTEAQLHAILDP